MIIRRFKLNLNGNIEPQILFLKRLYETSQQIISNPLNLKRNGSMIT